MNRLTWFGGNRGVRWNGDLNLHLLVGEEAPTFCGIQVGLRPVTGLEANSPEASWCPVCLDRAQTGHRVELGLEAPQTASQGVPGVFSGTERLGAYSGYEWERESERLGFVCDPEDVDESAGLRETVCWRCGRELHKGPSPCPACGSVA